jgi:uncharacterized membrane-anchored protein
VIETPLARTRSISTGRRPSGPLLGGHPSGLLGPSNVGPPPRHTPCSQPIRSAHLRLEDDVREGRSHPRDGRVLHRVSRNIAWWRWPLLARIVDPAPVMFSVAATGRLAIAVESTTLSRHGLSASIDREGRSVRPVVSGISHMTLEPGTPRSSPFTSRRHGANGAARSTRRTERVLRKVPEVTAYFWITKVLTTAMGESTSDYLVHRLDPIIAVGLGALGLAISLSIQFSARRYVPWIYWLAVLMVAVFGTMAADVLHIKFGVPYIESTIFFTAVLAVVFVAWYSREKTLSIHSITTPSRETFYWLTVVATFALGTAAGDMTAVTLHLGYLVSGFFFVALIAVPALAYRLFGLNEIFAFWFAYIVTRPLGASFADWMGKPHHVSGLGLGDGIVSLGLAILIVGFVGYMTVSSARSTS